MLISGKEIKIIYDDPWFWKISANKSISGGAPEHPQQKKPSIRFDESPRASCEPRHYKKSVVKKEPEAKAPTFAPRSLSSSPPRNRSPSPEPVADPAAVSINYGTLPVIPKKKRIIKKPVVAAAVPAPTLLEVQKEEGEITP
jgi:hypothetical protein